MNLPAILFALVAEQWADSGCQNRQADPFEGLIMLARFGFSVPDARIALEKGHAWP